MFPNPLTRPQVNLAQLASYEQAREYARILSSGSIVVGGGVRPETSDPLTSGIYRPLWNEQPWSQEPYWKDPATGIEYFFLHYRFQNGAEGMNVGLIMDKFKRYPSSPFYVLQQFANEANMLAEANR